MATDSVGRHVSQTRVLGASWLHWSSLQRSCGIQYVLLDGCQRFFKKAATLVVCIKHFYLCTSCRLVSEGRPIYSCFCTVYWCIEWFTPTATQLL